MTREVVCSDPVFFTREDDVQCPSSVSVVAPDKTATRIAAVTCKSFKHSLLESVQPNSLAVLLSCSNLPFLIMLHIVGNLDLTFEVKVDFVIFKYSVKFGTKSVLFNFTIQIYSMPEYHPSPCVSMK